MTSPIDKKPQSLSTQTIYKQISFYQLIDMLIKLIVTFLIQENRSVQKNVILNNYAVI